MKLKALIITLSAVVLVAVVACVGIVLYVNQPEIIFAGAVTDTVEDLLERDEIAPVYNVIKGGSVEFELNELDIDGKDMLNGVSASGKLYLSKKALMLEDLDISDGNTDLLADVYMSDSMLYIYEKNIIKEAYGAKFKDLEEDIENSVFAYDSDSEYAIKNEDEYNELIEACRILEDIDDLPRDQKKLIKKHLREIWDIFCSNTEFEVENKKVRVGDERIEARVISVAMDGDCIADIITDVYDYLCVEGDTAEFLDQYGGLFEYILGKNTGDSTYGEYYEDLLDTNEEIIELMCYSLRDSDEEFTIELVTPKHGRKMLKLSASEGKDTLFDIDLGAEGIKETDCIRVELDGTVVEYNVTQDTDSKFECSLDIDGHEVFNLTINKDREKYTLRVLEEVEGDVKNEYVAKGKFKQSGKKLMLTVEDISCEIYDDDKYGFYVPTEMLIDADISITLNEKDKIPSAPKDYCSISDIEESDVEDWHDKIGKIG